MGANILKAKDFLRTLCLGTVSDNVLASVPSIVPNTVNNFVVVSTPMDIMNITDYESAEMSEGKVIIQLFAEDIPLSGFGTEPNTALLGQMLDDLRDAVDGLSARDEYNLRESSVKEMISGYNGFHAWVVIYNLTIS